MLTVTHHETKPELPLQPTESVSNSTLDLLFKEARRRQRRRRMRWFALALVFALLVGTVAGFTIGAGGSSPQHHGEARPLATGTSPSVYTCQGTGAVRPRNLVVTCADAGIQLTNTRWSQWSSTGAVGVTTYTINFCKPACWESKFSHFPNSKVSFSAPISTKHGKFFSLLTVRWVMAGRTHVFRFSYRGYLAFK